MLTVLVDSEVTWLPGPDDRTMKAVLFTIFVIFFVGSCQLIAQDAERDSLPDNHLLFILYKDDSSFVGASEFLEGFSVSISLPDESADLGFAEGDLMSIIDERRITGVLTYPNGRSTVIKYEVVNHRGRDEIYMKTRQGYFIWESYKIRNDTLFFVIDWWYRPPASELDVRVIGLAEGLLKDSLTWRRDDDRQCQDDSETNRWSLFCALKHASIEVTGEYNHHNTVVQTARSVINEMIPDHGFAHTLMDFNNSPTTTHADVLFVLRQAKIRIMNEIRQSSE